MRFCGRKVGKDSTTILKYHNGYIVQLAMPKLSAQEFLTYIKEARRIATYKEYKRGLELFVEFYGKPLNVVLQERAEDVATGDINRNRRFSREIEKFHKWMIDKGYSINSARTNTLGIMQLFRFYGFPVMLESGSPATKTVQSTKDIVPTIEQYRAMFNVADMRARVILSMGLDLGWRVGDFVRLTKAMLPDLDQPTPIPFDLITEKETVLAKSFFSEETVELLKTYIPTLKPENPYLFQSNSKNHLDPETVSDILKGLAKTVKIKIPEGKRLRFHCFRKRFLSTCADLKIDVNTAKILTGKDVEDGMLRYLGEVNHKNAFLEVKRFLNLTYGKISSTIEQKDVEIEKLRKEIADLRLIMRGIREIFGEEIIKKAWEKFGIKVGPLASGKRVEHTLTSVALEVERREKKEYKRILEEDNGNHNGDQS
jgi:integrase